MNDLKFRLYNKLRTIIYPFDMLIERIPDRGSLLDVGCGYGTFCFILSNKRPNMKIVGIDMDRKRITTAKSKVTNQNLRFICTDMTKYSNDEKFDIVTCFDLIHHVDGKNHDLLITILKKLIKKNGILIIKDMNKKPAYKYIWNYLHDIAMTRSMKLNYLSIENMINLLEKNGLMIENVADQSNALYAHYLIICRRL